MRFAAFAALLFGCGRLNFNEAASSDAAIADGSVDAATIAVCGNGICEGTLGELCGMCAADCAVRTNVCGNGECQAGEDSTNCYADCGPTPWPWTQDEMDLFAAVNANRTAGVTCPGDAGPRTAPALTADASIVPGAREYAWEMAHHQIPASNISCNGRTFPEREAPYGANGGLSLSSSGPLANASQVVNVWKTSDTLCPVLMTTGPTSAATAVAHDASHGYVIWFK